MLVLANENVSTSELFDVTAAQERLDAILTALRTVGLSVVDKVRAAYPIPVIHVVPSRPTSREPAPT